MLLKNMCLNSIEQIRDCGVYKDEYKDCKCFRSRFNQYFIFGELLSCEQWREDYNNCQKFSWLDDKEAAKNLIRSELSRKAARFKAHHANDVWTKRDTPPANWSAPLPDFIEERNKNTYLAVKAAELKAQEERLKDPSKYPDSNKSSFCTFM